MPRERKTAYKKNESGSNLFKELWNAAVALRGSIEPADYKRYVLPLIFLRFLSLRYEQRVSEIDAEIADPNSDLFTTDKVIAREIREDPDNFKKKNVFLVPEAARWDNIVKIARADDIKLRLDNILALLEKTFPKLKGLLPPIYAGSNLDKESIAGLINLFSKDVFRSEADGIDMLGRVYEYFIGEFANSEGKRGGEYFTPLSIVRTLVAMLEPVEGKVFDPCCGAGGMFVQSDVFAHHSGKLSFFGQESKEFTFRLCRLNLFIHGIDGDIRPGNSYTNDQHADLKADYVLANPPFNDGAKGENGWGARFIAKDDARLRLPGETNPLPLAPRNANTMWILHFLAHLKNHTAHEAGGTAGFVMATGEPGGLVVDFIGIGEELKEATKKYTQGGGRGDPAPDISEEAKAAFVQALASVRDLMPELPAGKSYGDWRSLPNIEFEDLFVRCCGHLTETDELRDEFLAAEAKLNSTFSLVNHLADCIGYADEVVFYQLLRKQLRKTTSGPTPQDEDRAKAVRDLLDRSIESKGVVDIFAAAGIERADMSILDESFLEEFKSHEQENLRVKLLAKILADEIRIREKMNVTKYRSFREMLEQTLQKYHNRAIQAADVVRVMLEIRKDIDNEAARSRMLNLTPEEIAFYDAVAANIATLFDEKTLCDLIRDVVQSVKKNLKVDWTKPHREDVKAGVRAAVKNVLRKRGVKKELLETLTDKVIVQAEAMFKDWPLAA